MNTHCHCNYEYFNLVTLPYMSWEHAMELWILTGRGYETSLTLSEWRSEELAY